MDELLTIKKEEDDMPDYSVFQNSQTYKLDFLNSITFCTFPFIQLKVRYTTCSPWTAKRQKCSVRSNVNALNRDVSQSIASVSPRVVYAGLIVSVWTARISIRFSIIKKCMLRGAVNAPNLSAKKIIVNAFKKEKPAPRNAAASIVKILRHDSPVFHIVYFADWLIFI